MPLVIKIGKQISEEAAGKLLHSINQIVRTAPDPAVGNPQVKDTSPNTGGKVKWEKDPKLAAPPTLPNSDLVLHGSSTDRAQTLAELSGAGVEVRLGNAEKNTGPPESLGLIGSYPFYHNANGEGPIYDPFISYSGDGLNAEFVQAHWENSIFPYPSDEDHYYTFKFCAPSSKYAGSEEELYAWKTCSWTVTEYNSLPVTRTSKAAFPHFMTVWRLTPYGYSGIEWSVTWEDRWKNIVNYLIYHSNTGSRYATNQESADAGTMYTTLYEGGPDQWAQVFIEDRTVTKSAVSLLDVNVIGNYTSQEIAAAPINTEQLQGNGPGNKTFLPLFAFVGEDLAFAYAPPFPHKRAKLFGMCTHTVLNPNSIANPVQFPLTSDRALDPDTNAVSALWISYDVGDSQTYSPLDNGFFRESSLDMWWMAPFNGFLRVSTSAGTGVVRVTHPYDFHYGPVFSSVESPVEYDPSPYTWLAGFSADISSFVVEGEEPAVVSFSGDSLVSVVCKQGSTTIDPTVAAIIGGTFNVTLKNAADDTIVSRTVTVSGGFIEVGAHPDFADTFCFDGIAVWALIATHSAFDFPYGFETHAEVTFNDAKLLTNSIHGNGFIRTEGEMLVNDIPEDWVP